MILICFQLAQEYMHCNTQLQCLLQAKDNLEKELNSQDMGAYFENMREVKSENEALVLFHKELKEQLQILKGSTTPMFSECLDPEPGWVFVQRTPGRPGL